MNEKDKDVCEYLDIKSGDDAPNYDDGQWYRLEFIGQDSECKFISEFIYTEDKNLPQNDDFEKEMKSKGYTHYYCDPRVRGGWAVAAGAFRQWLS